MFKEPINNICMRKINDINTLINFEREVLHLWYFLTSLVLVTSTLLPARFCEPLKLSGRRE